MMLNENITSYFQTDHERLDRLFEDFQRTRKKEIFENFRSSLERHIQWEEELLFPVFEKASGMRDAGPTAVMRQEHQQIRQALKEIGREIESGNVDPGRWGQTLRMTLADHNGKEEMILYPMIDQFLTAEDLMGIFSKIKDVLSDSI